MTEPSELRGEIDAFASAIVKSRMMVEERLIAIALLAGAESLQIEWPRDLVKRRRMFINLGRRKKAKAMSLALTTARAWREELENENAK